MDSRSFRFLIEAYREVGGVEINLTGGEPTLHPAIGELIEMAADRSWKLILSTNGLAIRRILPQLRARLIDEVRISIHTTDNEFGRRLLGAAWSFQKVLGSMHTAKSSGIPVRLVFTYTTETARFLPEIAKLAYSMQLGLLVLDLINTRWMRVSPTAKPGADTALRALEPYATVVGEHFERGGCRMLSLRSSQGQLWQVKDMSFGRFFAPGCRSCSLRSSCGEGVYALRVDSEGVFKPCLLRKDLERRLPMPFKSRQQVLVVFAQMCELMAGPSSAIHTFPVGSFVPLTSLLPA